MENEEIICRYCLSYEDKETLIYPCLCKTPVHRECLDEWLKIKYNDKQCEICLENYQEICLIELSMMDDSPKIFCYFHNHIIVE